MKEINKQSRIPLYYQLMDIIVERIEVENLEEHDKLPSERELCEIYDVSRSTVRQAIQELEKEGYIYREHGKGTFVSPKKMKQELLRFYSFTEEMKKKGKKPTSKVLDFEVIQCNKEISKKMNLEVGAKVYEFTRLRLADGEPMMLETSYVPCYRFPNLTKKELQERPMYDIFIEKYNTAFTKAEEIFQSVLIRDAEAKFLEYPENHPGMMIERVTYERNMIIEYTSGIARGDRFKYHVVLNK